MKKGVKGLSYLELDIKQRIQAIIEMDKSVKSIFELPSNPYWIAKVVLECIISKIDPVFDEKGSIMNLSNRYPKITRDEMRKVYDQCKKLVP